ncbi:hypothetical protein EZV62_001109 [Acer yangbiense]|uniref:DUF4283 domain-containing protein n=1 Tax=Acer yangbiense TaxID=1000413 RepID=A0A5C7IT69_9ROSI|nr:hypothetical protein EZV62_001109 [Acer yangbiense]
MVELEIAKLYGKLSLADEDGVVHEKAEEDQRDGKVEVERCLVGKNLSGKKVNRDAFKNLIEQLWSQFGSVEVESVGVNIFMFHFNNQEERNRIWQRGPWYFDKSLIVLEKPEGMGNISQQRFNKVELWIQIHDVPIICMNKRIAKWMAEQLGCVVDIPTETKDCWGKFMRIGHASQDCSDEEAKSKALKSDFTKYGSWMRASVPDRQKMRSDQQIDGNSKVEGPTDTVRDPKENTIGTHTNILSTLSGLRSSQFHGLRLKGPSEEAQLNNKKSVVEGKEIYGLGLNVIIPTDCKFGPALKPDGPSIASDPIEEMAMLRVERIKKANFLIQYRSSTIWRSLIPKLARDYDRYKLERLGYGESPGILGLEEIEDTDEGMAQVIQEYFHSLFKSSNPSPTDISKASKSISSCFSSTQREELNADFTAEDVRVCLSVLNGNSSIKEFNNTAVVLIPKIKNPTSSKDFRPISLCSVVYKTVSKIVASRLKPYLQDIISPNQSAFVPEGKTLIMY